eukprot:3213345-Rhodomonas_salina.1
MRSLALASRSTSTTPRGADISQSCGSTSCWREFASEEQGVVYFADAWSAGAAADYGVAHVR